jgi:hypothetical protein
MNAEVSVNAGRDAQKRLKQNILFKIPENCVWLNKL